MRRDKNSRICFITDKCKTRERENKLFYFCQVLVSPGLSVFHRSAALLSLLSGAPMGPKLENGTELWLCVGGELGRLLGLEE